MRIEAEVLGVEQAVDFNTMETSACVVIEILGELVRVPISEEQMERLTLAAVEHRNTTQFLAEGADFDETREMSKEELPPEQQVRLADAPEREFSVMRELAEHTAEETPGLEGLFDFDGEAEKVEKLRQRPAPPPPAPSGLPRLPGTSADDDFPQD